MAKVGNFLYCLNANISQNEANIIGVLNAITPDYIPGAFSFSVFCSILDLEDGNHVVNMEFINPDGLSIIKVDGVIPYENIETSNLSRQHLGINISSYWQNVVFKTQGIYKTIVHVDGKECGTYPISVKGKN